MSGLLERAEVLHEWGIEPVPETHRRLNGFDIAILWGDLGIGLLVLVTGSFLAPALGLVEAAVAIVLGSVIGVGLLALVAGAGAQHGLTTMVLFRPVLGLKGSWIPSALNVAQLIGWTAVEFWAMSFVADIVSRRVFGFSARGLWLVIAAVVCTGLAWWGPVGVTRVWMKRFAAWMVAGIALVITILIFTTDPEISFTRAGTGGLPFGAALDLVIAMPISWLPLVADYTRFTTNRRAASIGTFGGYFVANVWFYALGYLLLLTTATGGSPAAIAAGVLALAGGTVAGVLFLVGLLAGESDEAFADIYSTAVSMQNIWPNAPQRLLVGLVGLIAALLAGWLTMERYEGFLFLIGSVFVPLFGVFLADHFVNRRGRIVVHELYGGEGSRYDSGLRAAMLVPWVAGFVVYHLILPVGPTAWLEWMGRILGDPLIGQVQWMGASVPAFVVAFLLTLGAGRLSSSRPSTQQKEPT